MNTARYEHEIQTWNSESKLIRDRGHQNIFTKCLEKNVHPKKLDIKWEHIGIAFATNYAKENLSQLDLVYCKL